MVVLMSMVFSQFNTSSANLTHSAQQAQQLNQGARGPLMISAQARDQLNRT
jgi:hypothetical protein